MKPMLAAATDGQNLAYPWLVSPKLDGIRCLVIDGKLMTRSLKPVPNLFLQSWLGLPELNGLDGELIVGEPTAKKVFQVTTSLVMSIDGQPPVPAAFHVFDSFLHPGAPFKERQYSALATATFLMKGLLKKSPVPVKMVYQSMIHDEVGLLDYEGKQLLQGYEGVMLRDPAGIYKEGRSTLKERGLLKLKRFEDSEAVIIGAVEQLTNFNESKRNALGYLEKSTMKEGLRGAGVLGAWSVRDVQTGVEFEVGSGYTAAQRSVMWDTREVFLGKIIRYKYQPIGVKDKPRFPVFQGFRDEKDL